MKKRDFDKNTLVGLEPGTIRFQILHPTHQLAATREDKDVVVIII